MPVPRAVRLLGPPALSLAGVLALVLALRPYHHAIGAAIDRMSLGALAALTGLSMAALALRTEVWRIGLAAAGRRPPPAVLHAANAGTFVVSLASHLFAPAVKLWMLRRLRPCAAGDLVGLVAVDVALVTLEVLLAALLVVYAALEGTLRWWVPALMLVACGVVLALAREARRRHPEHPALEGLEILRDRRHRTRMLAVMTAVFALQILRGWIALRAVGLHPSVSDAVLVFVATGVLGVLPTGIVAAPTAATLLVAGARGTGAAAGAGVVLTATLTVGTLIYATVAALALAPNRAVEQRNEVDLC